MVIDFTNYTDLQLDHEVHCHKVLLGRHIESLVGLGHGATVGPQTYNRVSIAVVSVLKSPDPVFRGPDESSSKERQRDFQSSIVIKLLPTVLDNCRHWNGGTVGAVLRKAS